MEDLLCWADDGHGEVQNTIRGSGGATDTAPSFATEHLRSLEPWRERWADLRWLQNQTCSLQRLSFAIMDNFTTST